MRFAAGDTLLLERKDLGRDTVQLPSFTLFNLRDGVDHSSQGKPFARQDDEQHGLLDCVRGVCILVVDTEYYRLLSLERSAL